MTKEKRTFFPMKFCQINLDGVSLKHIQVGNINYQYELNSVPNYSDSRIIVNISSDVIRKDFEPLFSGDETGYIEHKNQFFYRNCNTVVNTEGHELFYRGKFFNSFLQINWKKHNDLVTININVTNAYLAESRSRLSRSSKFDALVNHLIMHFSVTLGYIPFHAGAVNTGETSSTLLMGLPNTGKTTTALKISEDRGTAFIAEDIVFVDKKDLLVYSCPFTMNPKSPERFSAHSYIGHSLESIIILNRSDDKPYVKDLGIETLQRMVTNMNYFEFTWMHDVQIRHLFFQGDTSLSNVTLAYLEGQKEICERVSGIELGGNTPSAWNELLKNKI